MVLQDPCTTFETALWKEALEALFLEFAIGPEMPDADVLPALAEKSALCQLVARMTVGTNKVGKAQTVDLFDLAPAVSAEGVLAAFHELSSLPGDDGDGLAPLRCQRLRQDEMGQPQAKIESQSFHRI